MSYHVFTQNERVVIMDDDHQRNFFNKLRALNIEANGEGTYEAKAISKKASEDPMLEQTFGLRLDQNWNYTKSPSNQLVIESQKGTPLKINNRLVQPVK